MTTASAVRATHTCGACGSRRVKLLRHSEQWNFDVGRCPDCRTVAVIDPPPDKGEREYVEGAFDWPEYMAGQRGDDALRLDVLERIHRRLTVGPDTRPQLFDVGAGVGEFVALAREHGFDAGGNDISARGIQHALERHGLTISPLLLGDQPAESTDAISMWCVLAHVADPAQFLREALAMLRPGGILFLRTPRWCAIDTVGSGLARVSRNRFHRLADRRITSAHLHLYKVDGMTSLLTSAGFTDLTVEPACHYPFSTKSYLDTTGGVAALARRFSAGLDVLIERDKFVRNTLMVYARRPL